MQRSVGRVWFMAVLALIPTAAIGALVGALVMHGLADMAIAGAAGPTRPDSRDINHWTIGGAIVGALAGVVWLIARGFERADSARYGLSAREDDGDEALGVVVMFLVACIPVIWVGYLIYSTVMGVRHFLSP